jgi:hypothetical protein
MIFERGSGLRECTSRCGTDGCGGQQERIFVWRRVLAVLSVAHASSLESYRAAEEIGQSAASGTASTEDLRQAMIYYRALFADLLGEPADAQSRSAATGPAQIDVAADATSKNGDAQVAGTQPVEAAAPASKASTDGNAGICRR